MSPFLWVIVKTLELNRLAVGCSPVTHPVLVILLCLHGKQWAICQSKLVFQIQSSVYTQ